MTADDTRHGRMAQCALRLTLSRAKPPRRSRGALYAMKPFLHPKPVGLPPN